MQLWHDLLSKQALYTEHGGRPSMLRVIMSDGTSANVLYRAMRASMRLRLYPVAYLFQYLNKLVNHCIIGLHAEFGPGLIIVHPVGVVVNSAVRGGKRVAIESGVVIGDAKGRSPVIGDDVFVGSGAKILGGVHIGSGARIGANAVVLHDVPAHTTAVGIPAKVVRRREAMKQAI